MCRQVGKHHLYILHYKCEKVLLCSSWFTKLFKLSANNCFINGSKFGIKQLSVELFSNNLNILNMTHSMLVVQVWKLRQTVKYIMFSSHIIFVPQSFSYGMLQNKKLKTQTWKLHKKTKKKKLKQVLFLSLLF